MIIRHLMRQTRFATPVLIAALAGSLPAAAGTAVRFTLDRKIDGTAAPFFLALDKDYFKDEALDVTIDSAAGGPLETLNGLAAGKAELAVSDLNRLITFRDAGGAPIKAIFTLFDKPPYAIIARKSRGITHPGDLVGKKLAAPVADPTFAQWPVFAQVAGIDAGKVAIENVGQAVCMPMLAAGEIDAVTGFSFLSYIDLKAAGVPPDDLVVLPLADYGLALYGEAIMVAPAFAQQKPGAVEAFVRATVRALQDTLYDPAAAIAALLRHSDGLKQEVELARLRMAIRDNIVTPAVRANGLGGIDTARLTAAIDQIGLAYHFKAKDKAAAAFDASFLPPADERRIDDTGSR
jgi:NitT/TauT family transport system substrate-binding protein